MIERRISQAASTSDDELLSIRMSGARLLVLLFWVNVVALGIAGFTVGSADVWMTTAIGAMLCIIPTLLVFVAKRIDAAARLAIGLTTVSFPALFVFLFSGHLWQMDMHMYFFPALAALAVLCDKRPIIAGAGFIAAHHMLFNFIAPTWVFSGTGDLPRVLLHAWIVILQTAVLLWVTDRLNALIVHMAREVRMIEALRIEGARRIDAETASLQQSTIAAQHISDADKVIRATSDAADRRRQLADDIEARLGAIVTDLGAMATQLSSGKEQLAVSFDQTVERSSELRQSHAKVEDDVWVMRSDTERLAASIHEVGRNAADARETAHSGAQTAAELTPKVAELALTVEAASQIIKLISTIASKTRMLALNATIEAARVQGHAFGIVAGEMKSLAGQTTKATQQIAALLDDIRRATHGVSASIGDTSEAVHSIDRSAANISTVVHAQIVATTDIAAAAEMMAHQVAQAAGEADALGAAIGAVRDVIEQTNCVASAVSKRSVELDATVKNVLAELRAA